MDLVVSTPALRAALRFSMTATWQSPLVSNGTSSISGIEEGLHKEQPWLEEAGGGILYEDSS
jgi:hypothetical protein